MKLFIMILGLACIAAGIMLVPAVLSSETQTVLVEAFKPLTVSGGIALAFAAAGIVFLFIGGVLWGKGSSVEVPVVCPECGEDLGDRIKCPSCEINALPPVFALDTVSLIGAVLSLLLAGAVVGSPFIKLAGDLTGMLVAATLSVSFVSTVMSLSSMIAERRKVGISVIAFILSGGVLGTMVYILL
ncbi:hypothetical protein ACFL6F_01770 [Planctomycetota bacterium]